MCTKIPRNPSFYGLIFFKHISLRLVDFRPNPSPSIKAKYYVFGIPGSPIYSAYFWRTIAAAQSLTELGITNYVLKNVLH